MLGTLPIAGQTAGIHHGLAPGIKRRISEYIDSHLGENISLEAMAEMAGLIGLSLLTGISTIYWRSAAWLFTAAAYRTRRTTALSYRVASFRNCASCRIL
jgi:hypothetical protein